MEDSRPKKSRKSKPKLVWNHIIYGLPENKKRQSDLGCFITEGVHTVVTDAQYSVALNDRMAGWCLLFEGLKRIMRSDIEQFNKENGLCPSKTGKTTKVS